MSQELLPRIIMLGEQTGSNSTPQLLFVDTAAFVDSEEAAEHTEMTILQVGRRSKGGGCVCARGQAGPSWTGRKA